MRPHIENQNYDLQAEVPMTSQKTLTNDKYNILLLEAYLSLISQINSLIYLRIPIQYTHVNK